MGIEPIALDGRLCDLWNRCLAYPLDLRLLHHNRPPLAFGALLDHAVVGFALGRPGFLDAIGVLPEHRARGLGTALLKAVDPHRIGGGPAHFFPGVPDPHAESGAFFEKLGFRPDWTALDLRRHHGARLAMDPRVEPCRDPEKLLAFLAREFPGRWLTDTRRRVAYEAEPILVAMQDGECVAFVHTFSPGDRVLGPSVFWRGLLEDDWGGLGPVGVAAHARKQGLGLALVTSAVAYLQTRGCNDLVVDWTGLPEFYERAGFRIWQRYRSYVR